MAGAVEWEDLAACLKEISALRHRGVTPFDLKVASSVFGACSKALADWRKSDAVWRAVPAPTGGGKTTAAFAFAVALVRAGGSVLFLANTRRECDEAYRTLEPLLPGKVAIRTTDHDQQKLDELGPEYVEATKARDDGYTPAAFFYRSQLGDYPALVGTHSSYKRNESELLKLANGERRALILVDERPDDIDVADFTLADFEQIHELCRKRGLDEYGEEPDLTKAFGEAWRQLAEAQLSLDRSHPYHELRINLEPHLIAALKHFAESKREPSRLAVGTRFDGEALRLAARLVILAQETHGFAFAALHTDFAQGARLVAYAPNWPLKAGTVLLDATSDIDGYKELSSARKQEVVPEANYRLLEPTHLDGPSYLTGPSPKDQWDKATTRKPLLKWFHRCVLENTNEGETILIVSWKKVIEGGQLQALSWQGRSVDYCHFGAGIGSNQWRDCGAVFIFGDYIKPTRITIAETNGIKETPFRATADATVRGLKGDYLTTKVGLMLRWFKQLAMRGCARELDDNGVARPMRLYFSTTEFRQLDDHWNRMFPGSPMPTTRFVGDEETQTSSCKPRRRKSVADDLLKFLSMTEKDEVTSSDILDATGIELKSQARKLKDDKEFLESCARRGWTYVPARGRGQMTKLSRIS
ncbi:MAG: DEAD/DEAH box helicase family protein [Acidobacteriota bacterium]